MDLSSPLLRLTVDWTFYICMFLVRADVNGPATRRKPPGSKIIPLEPLNRAGERGIESTVDTEASSIDSSILACYNIGYRISVSCTRPPIASSPAGSNRSRFGLLQIPNSLPLGLGSNWLTLVSPINQLSFPAHDEIASTNSILANTGASSVPTSPIVFSYSSRPSYYRACASMEISVPETP